MARKAQTKADPKWRCADCGRFVPECALFHVDDKGQINVCAECAERRAATDGAEQSHGRDQCQ